MKLFVTNRTENISNPAAHRQQRINESRAITACLFNACFSGNLIIVSRIKVCNILTGKSLRNPALNKPAAR